MKFDSRIMSFYHEMKEIDKEKFSRPRYMGLYPTNMCQFNCTFCDYKKLNNEPPKYLKESEWSYILSSFKDFGGEAVDLCGGGEPLMLPTIESLLKHAKKIGLKVGVVTNGLSINKYTRPDLYQLLLETCSYVRVSFEAGSPEVFKSIKGSDRFGSILENVSYLIQDKPKDMEVSYKYTIPQSYSVTDMEEAIFLADTAKFNSIQFKAVCNSEEALGDSDRRWIENFIKPIDTEFTEVICNLKRSEKTTKKCFISSIQTIIDYFGDVYLCCYYNHRTKSHKIGNIGRNKLEEIWGSYKHYEIACNVNISECNVYDCRYIRYEKIMKDLMNTNYLSFI
jgi:MoaA/NifB/PqqE/SkfB family radical SAM enzyme